MTEFEVFFKTGYDHIVAADGLDHILFIVVLAAVYPIEEWRKILVLVTAFTIGHSLTLALATLEFVQVNRSLIEFLIPITILVTAILNFYEKPSFVQKNSWRRGHMLRYLLAMIFGFIHGFAFSGQLLALFGGMGDRVFWPLLGFNLGIELGQILVVFIFLCISVVLIKILKLKAIYWNMGLSTLAIIASIGILIHKILNFLIIGRQFE